jgi:hypothetical protein
MPQIPVSAQVAQAATAFAAFNSQLQQALFAHAHH